ncbi:purine nucleoside phosphorylase-like isoform X2 [Bacillus rossius redtenbacheri]|uniref:purine nucleoside phosphorylase-like isoform X2 n=1 Tax=Bacillus rossius redtenbacheri TaxID=93214 RepID=UPI002FDE98B5
MPHKAAARGATDSKPTRYTYEVLTEIAQHLLEKTKIRPKIGIILGTGIGPVADILTDRTVLPYESIPHFPRSTTAGHIGELVFGTMEGVPVVCMRGRFHFFEGYPASQCAMPVRVMKLMGATHLIASNAAGSVRRDLTVGNIMIMKDHINMLGLTGHSPLRGPNEERFGERFPAMNRAYNRDLIKTAKEIAKELGIQDQVKEGVYACLGGPQFETIAEVKLMQTLGADCIGMSTVHEVTTARHCGMAVFAFSLVTNVCVMDYESLDQPDHTEVLQSARRQEPVLTAFVSGMVRHIGRSTEQPEQRSAMPAKRACSCEKKKKSV